jgi:malate synthase A
MTQNELGLPQGTIKATVLIETILAAFEMDEILYELREHSAGLNAGPLGLHLLVHQDVQERSRFLSCRSQPEVTMTAPFMRAYALLLLKTCHKRNAPAMGGMSALIPIKNDRVRRTRRRWPASSRRQDARCDRRLRRRLGRPPGSGGEAAMEEFVKRCSATGDNQIDKKRDDVKVSRARILLNFQPRGTDHRSRPADEHQCRHPVPWCLAGRQRLRADPQPDGGCRHRGDQPLARCGSGSASQGRARSTAARSPPRWCAPISPRSSPR